MKTLVCSVVAFLLHLLTVNGLVCTPQGTDPIGFCAMCSQTNAGVRLNLTDEDFDYMRLKYTCRHPNNSEIVIEEDDPIDDSCFEGYPYDHDNWIKQRTGVVSVGHELATGVECNFRVSYRLVDGERAIKQSSCTIKSPEACAANPESCQIDRVSVMNEDGECPEHQCAEGYGGELCNNVNECEANNTSCDEHADCHDTDGSYWCECRAGFLGDGYNCTDIDECVSLNETCLDENTHCVNSVGNFSCQCDPGFTGDGYNCSDVDECLEEGVCHTMATCANTEGSVECKCLSGYSGDGYECSDINECALLNGPCDENALCTNIEGSYECECKEGFQGDGCSDVNECALLDNACDRDAECANTLGSYQCNCNAGYTGDGYTCSASICTRVGGTCHRENSFCTEDEKKTGIYRCTCLPGFREKAGNCTDIDECEEGSYTCSNNTVCSNIVGHYQCLTESPDNIAARLTGGIFSVVILLLTLATAGILLYLCTTHSKNKKEYFQELTKMDLDPYYSPSFWKGSLTSFHSIYEKLDFSKSTTDITHYSENCEQQTNIESEDCASVTTADKVVALVPPSPTVEPTHGELCKQTQTTDYQPGDSSAHFSNSFTDTSSTARDASVAIDIDSVSISDVVASLEEETFPNSTNTKSNCENPSSEDTATQHVKAMHTVAGYIQENCITESNTNTVGTTESVVSGLQVALSLEKGGNPPRKYSEADSGGGYVTESETSALISNAYDRQESCSSDQDGSQDEKHSFRYVAHSVSSGYASESMAGEPNSPCTRTCDRVWHSQTSLGSDGTENLGEIDLRSVKFTVNAHQEFEYVNAMEDTLEDVCFVP